MSLLAKSNNHKEGTVYVPQNNFPVHLLDPARHHDMLCTRRCKLAELMRRYQTMTAAEGKKEITARCRESSVIIKDMYANKNGT